MKKALLIASVLFIAVISTACINNIAVQELNNKAAEFMQKGDYESAMNRLEASIDLDSSMYETYYNLGIAATNAKNYEKAIDAFQNGLKVRADYANFYYSLAVAQADLAEELLETENVSEEDKAKAMELKASAIENAKKYLEMSPQAEDKDEVEDFLEDLTKEEKEEPTKVLEG